MYWTLGNSKGPVLGPVPNLGPVLILGPWDRSGPDRLQTLGGCLYQCSCEIENLHQVLSITISIVDTIRIFVNLRSPTPLRGEHEQLLIEGVEEDDEDSRLEAALRGELKAEVLKGEESQVRIQMPFISNIQ